MKRYVLILIIFITIVIVSGCGTQGDSLEKPSLRPRISVSILPQKFFLEKLTGDQFFINVMIPPGYSPATYEPTPKQIRLLNDSLMYFRIGHIPFEEGWIGKFQSLNPSMKVIDTSKGIRVIEQGQKEDQPHPGETGHHRSGVDPHYWLSPRSVMIIASNTCRALAAEFPEKKEFYISKLNLFLEELKVLDCTLEKKLRGIKNRSFLAFHPAWSYFARDYGLRQLTIETGGKSPNPSEMMKVIKESREQKIGIIFIQKQFRRDTAEIIAREIQARIVQLDPLAYHWDVNMEKIGQEFKKALSYHGKR